MGPIALFDESFLQSLSLDEAVWFDHFFIANVAPVFFVETLADLEKAVREGRTPESEVGVVAEKTPVLGGAPCANHLDMAIGELLGCPIPMTGQIPVAEASSCGRPRRRAWCSRDCRRPRPSHAGNAMNFLWSSADTPGFGAMPWHPWIWRRLPQGFVRSG